MRRIDPLLFAAILSCAALPAVAQDGIPPIAPAEPGSAVDSAGQVILYFAGGRTLEEAGGPSFNPYGINGEDLLYTLRAFFVTTEYDGTAVHEGELSIYPQFSTPLGAYEASDVTPGIIPYALMQGGTCHAGFVTGHPAPDSILAVDMTGQVCHAAIVEEIVSAHYAAAASTVPGPVTEPAPAVVPGFDPEHPTDIDLDVIVWAAYRGAYEYALTNRDHRFVRDGDDSAVRVAIRDSLEQEGIHGILFLDPLEDPAEAFGCVEPGTTALRMSFTADGAGITLVAASSRRHSSHVYDPMASTELVVQTARECRAEGLGRTSTSRVE